MDCRMGESVCGSFSDDVTGDVGNFECNFECNICFELPNDPIVTLCGHLYCWPCLCRWLQLHSHFHECPICKAIVHEDKLIPIYGRGKPVYDPRSHPIPGVTIRNQQPDRMQRLSPYTGANTVQVNELDPMVRFMPMAAARFGHATLSTLFSVLPSIYNHHFHGFHDATIYGLSSSASDFSPSSFHGDLIQGSNLRCHPVAWKLARKFILAGLGVVVLILLQLFLS